uniref:Myb-like domain-containing protein n=1 Tax=Tetraselmis chuii TaxID=63592 RepID=A0A7S1X7U3_9CHLO|mmetsp:Transcript_40970/g.73632  ORF Transcript_40970/g.73632 Transcript_40970/m.73632 type:complete len:282 (+) Transcript_40970:881-1726(+)
MANKVSDSGNRRKRSAGEAMGGGGSGKEAQASPGRTKPTKRRVQVVSTTSWPKPGEKAPDWSKRAAALAMVAAAAEREEQREGDSDSATTASNEHATGGGEDLEYSSKHDARLGMWSEKEKRDLVNAVRELNPCGAGEWEAVGERLGRGPRGGASAERMYRTLTDPAYHKSSNPHGRRINPRKGSTPMHVMASYALQRLPENEGNLSQIGDLIKSNPHFSKELDWSPRPGTKTYPRWKDALVGCFKPGRYPHLIKTERKTDGLTVYKLDQTKVRTAFEETK